MLRITILTVVVSMILFSCRQNNDLASENQLIVPEGLKAELWAQSPMFYNPTAMDVDARGRIWITEAVNYRDFKNNGEHVLHHSKGDRVMILEDTDGDGRADQSRVFVQDADLHSPVGISVLGNKVIVSSAPNMIVYTDEDGDDRPDHKEVILTGFGGYDHDHSLHSVVVGPDGYWYFNIGNAGPHVVTDRSGWTLRSGSVYNGGTPYNKDNRPGLISDDGRLWTGGLALRMNPDGTGLRVMAHNFRNAYELILDSYGNMWQNDNDDQVTTCRTTWVMENGNAGYFSADGSRFWQADKRPDQSMFTAHWHQDDPGVMPAGDNTGAGAPTGITLYESDALGLEYRGILLSADAGRNEVFGYLPEEMGAGFDLSNRFRFATSVPESTENYRWSTVDQDTTRWFRPSDVTVGTDGSIYIADWYDPIVGGHSMDDTVGFGRIYRISPVGKDLINPDLDLTTTEGQIKALLNPATNVRNSGFLALKEQGETKMEEVKNIIGFSENPYHQARAIWLMAQLGDQGVEEVIRLLESSDSQHRLVAYRALRAVLEPDALLNYSAQMAKDSSEAIRREVAITLRDVPLNKCEDIILNLVSGFDGRDRWYLEALGTAMDGKVSVIYPLLKHHFGSDPLKWSQPMTSLAWRLHPVESVPDFEQRAMSIGLSVDERIRMLTGLAFIPDKNAADAMNRIYRQVNQKKVKERALYWLEHRSTNDWAGYYQVENQERKVPPEVAEWKVQLMNGDLGLEQKEQVMSQLAHHPDGARILIQLAASNWLTVMDKKKISSWIFENPDPTIRVLASEFFDTPESDVSYRIPEILQLSGNIKAGEEIFKRVCASCHRFDDQGGTIGPDLTAIRSKMDRRTLLDAIIYPNADVVFGYDPVKITLEDGKTHTGFIQGEGAQLILKDATGQLISVDTSDIVKREMVNSLMPPPGILGLKEQDLADVVRYLMGGAE